MRIATSRIFSIIISLVFSIASVIFSQEPNESQRDLVKSQVEYNLWENLLSSKPEVNYADFKLDSSLVTPWLIQREQKIGAANGGRMVQYVLAKEEDPQKTEETLLVSVTICSSRAIAAEGLIDHLLGIQRPDFRLVGQDSLELGDLSVAIKDDPEPAIYFFRGNVLISVENAGTELAGGIRELAHKLDANFLETIK